MASAEVLQGTGVLQGNAFEVAPGDARNFVNASAVVDDLVVLPDDVIVDHGCILVNDHVLMRREAIIVHMRVAEVSGGNVAIVGGTQPELKPDTHRAGVVIKTQT
jgi:hypothetical protein